jgi:hypothetical protein
MPQYALRTVRFPARKLPQSNYLWRPGLRPLVKDRFAAVILPVGPGRRMARKQGRRRPGCKSVTATYLVSDK